MFKSLEVLVAKNYFLSKFPHCIHNMGATREHKHAVGVLMFILVIK